MASAFCAALFLAATILAAMGAGQTGTVAALRVTGRLAFLFFWPAYTGGALTALFGPTFKGLKQYGRELGLAFASVMLVHFGLVAWLCRIGHAPGESVFAIFGIAAFWTVLLVIVSIDRLRQALGAWGWWVVRVIGLNYIACAFLIDFTRDPFHGGVKHRVEYLPFAVLAATEPMLWFAAQALRLTRLWRKAPC